MLDLGWQELFLITLVALLVVGPKDLPSILRSISRWIRGARSAVRTFQDTIEEVARETELEEIRSQTNQILVGPVSEVLETAKNLANSEDNAEEFESPQPPHSPGKNAENKLPSENKATNRVRDLTPETKD